MLKITESDYPNVIYMEVDGGVTKKDTDEAAEFISRHCGESSEINVLAYFKKIQNVEVGALVKGTFVDMWYWNQYEKIAFVTDDERLKKAASVADYLPGLNVREYDKAEMDDAWSWLSE